MDPPILPQQISYRGLVTDLTIPHLIKQALQEASYLTTADILQVSASDLSTELSVNLSQAEDILRQCRNPPGPSRPPSLRMHGDISRSGHHTEPPQQAQDIQNPTAQDLTPSSSPARFSTLSQTLDTLIAQCISADGGDLGDDKEGSGSDSGTIGPGMAVEISGPPGIGKTCMAIGLALDARLRRERTKGDTASGDRAAGEVLIIDTEGSIPPDRLYKAAKAITRTVNTLLDGLHLVRIATQVQMIAFLNLLDDWLQDHPKVHLVIIDSLSFHFRQPNLDLTVRRRIMDVVKQQVGKATTIHHCAVILITQMSTKVLSAEGKRVNFDTGEKAVLMPQLGDMWQTAKTLRIALFRGPDGNEVRYAHVGTSSHSDPDGEWACFDIDTDGLPMDVEDSK